MTLEQDDSGYKRLEDQISWYDQKSGLAQRNYKLTKYLTIVASATVPIFAIVGFEHSQYLVAGLGAAIAVFEGINQVNPVATQLDNLPSYM